MKQTPVPSFVVLQRILFSCLRCGKLVEMKQGGIHHVSSGEYCEHCNARYDALWHDPIEQSEVMLVEEG